MKRNYVLAGLGLIALLAIASSALGGPSLKKLVKKEVAKQISNATGPAGAAGAPGAAGADGSARAYAYVNRTFCSGGGTQTCSLSRDKGVTSVTTTVASGIYCATVPGLSPQTTPAVATVDPYNSNYLNDLVTWSSTNSSCALPEFEFHTANAAGTASSGVSFSFVIP